MNLADIQKRVLASSSKKYLLDEYPNAAAAYSLRKLRSGYTGDCIEVRRSSDNTTQNIGFVNDVLDTASLLSFVGAGNGFVRIWYDQSGNGRDASNTTNAAQPQIVLNGNLLLQNTKPTINHISTTFLEIASDFNFGRTYSFFGALKFNQNNKEWLGSTQQLTYSYAMYSESVRTFHLASLRFNSTPVSFGLNFGFISIFRNNSRTISMFKNGTQMGSDFNISGDGDFIYRNLSGEMSSGFRLVGNLSETILYASFQSTNRTGIESNINAYYNIY